MFYYYLFKARLWSIRLQHPACLRVITAWVYFTRASVNICSVAKRFPGRQSTIRIKLLDTFFKRKIFLYSLLPHSLSLSSSLFLSLSLSLSLSLFPQEWKFDFEKLDRILAAADQKEPFCRFSVPEPKTWTTCAKRAAAAAAAPTSTLTSSSSSS